MHKALKNIETHLTISQISQPILIKLKKKTSLHIIKRIEELEKMTNATSPNILVVLYTDFEKTETTSFVHS